MLLEVKRLAEGGACDYIIIESTGISEPLQVAETFTFVDEESGESLSAWAALDTMVTVVDAFHFFDYVDSEKNVQDTGEAVGPDDLRALSQLLVDQVEFADVILINKSDLATSAQLDRVEHAVRALNAHADIVRTTQSAVPLESVLATGKFNFERAARNPGWLKVLRGTHVPESEEYGISSFVYRADRPFHPERLYALTGQPVPLPNVIRSKGFVWLGTCAVGSLCVSCVLCGRALIAIPVQRITRTCRAFGLPLAACTRWSPTLHGRTTTSRARRLSSSA